MKNIYDVTPGDRVSMHCEGDPLYSSTEFTVVDSFLPRDVSPYMSFGVTDRSPLMAIDTKELGRVFVYPGTQGSFRIIS